MKKRNRHKVSDGRSKASPTRGKWVVIKGFAVIRRKGAFFSEGESIARHEKLWNGGKVFSAELRYRLPSKGKGGRK